MRASRVAVSAGAAATGVALTLLAAGPASAYASRTVSTVPSAKDGYGTANASLTGGDYWFKICDRGTADGYRTVGRLSKDGTSWSVTRHAANGTDTCVGGSEDSTSSILPQPLEGYYTIKVCLRDGADGADFNCSSLRAYYDGSAWL
ncbi:nuclear export factor GLE1 [Streptomyces laurentii]|uniref:Nuclear export factor GLE1 n=1 Tax=Streptomyces laurentii TaxID=39478 RepID=A0A160NU81_STRLU|nr:nuclear export factor GLE1 [Streptomyces laurentii]